MNQCEKYGVKVITYGKNLTEAEGHAKDKGKEDDLYYISGYVV